MRTPRRFWPLVALALLVAAGALLHGSRRVPSDRGRPPAPATVRVVAGPADVRRGRNPENAGRRSPGAAAREFALAYLRYLDGRAGADALSGANAGVRRIALLAGPIPAGARAGELQLERLGPAPGSISGRLTLVASDRTHTFYAQLTASPATSGWIVTGLVPPDYPTVLSTGHPRTPSAPAAAQAAAAAFVDTYIPWTYGQLSAGAIRAVSSALRASLAEDPPHVPPAIRRLRPQIGRPVLEWGGGADAWRGWAVIATVSDGLNRYQLSAQLERGAGRWVAVKLLPTG